MEKIYPICVPYTIETEFEDYINEYNIRFRVTSKVEELIQFLNDRKQYRFNIEFVDDVNYSVIKTIVPLFDNIYFRLDGDTSIDTINMLIELNAKFFINEKSSAINWNRLSYMVEVLKVNEVYIADDLCFEMDAVYKYCNEHNVGIRCVLNDIPTTRPDCGDDYAAMMYLPEYFDEYSKYFSSFEFIYPKDFKIEYLRSFKTAWFEHKDWIGPLSLIIPATNLEFPRGGIIMDAFISTKLNCKNKCKKGMDCERCEILAKLNIETVKKLDTFKE